jgi:hypothetical protein
MLQEAAFEKRRKKMGVPMKRLFCSGVCALSMAATFALLSTNVAHADNTLNITYFTISASDPDAGTLCCGVSDNEVQSLLGPDGMPVLNTGMTGAPVPTDVNSGTGELTYWDPSLNSHVTQNRDSSCGHSVH